MQGSMYVRVKRHMSTWFVVCDPTDLVRDVKRKLQELTERAVAEQRLVHVSTGEVLEDSRTLADQRVENDSILGLVLKREDGPGWEDLHIEKPEDHMAGLDAEVM